MAKDKNKIGRTPQNDASDRERKSRNDPATDGSQKPGAGSGSMKQKSDRGDIEERYTNDSDAGTPKGGSKRGGQVSTPDRNSQRIDDDDEEEDDMDFRRGSPTGAPRNR